MEPVIRRLEQVAMAIAVACMVAIMLTVSTDTFARYVMNAPLPWAFDLVTYYLMVAAVYGALASTYTRGDHVAITLFQSMIPPRALKVIESVCSLMVAGAFLIIAYGAGHATYEAYARNEFLPGYFVWPAWLSQLPVPVGCALIAFRLIHHAWTVLRHGEDPYVQAFHEEEASE